MYFKDTCYTWSQKIYDVSMMFACKLTHGGGGQVHLYHGPLSVMQLVGRVKKSEGRRVPGEEQRYPIQLPNYV